MEIQHWLSIVSGWILAATVGWLATNRRIHKKIEDGDAMNSGKVSELKDSIHDKIDRKHTEAIDRSERVDREHRDKNHHVMNEIQKVLGEVHALQLTVTTKDDVEKAIKAGFDPVMHELKGLTEHMNRSEERSEKLETRVRKTEEGLIACGIYKGERD